MRLIKLNGEEIDLRAKGLKRLTYDTASLSLSHTTEQLDGDDGAILLDSKHDVRIITAEFAGKAMDLADMYLLKNETNRLFAKKEPFYVVFHGDPAKRWLVILNKPIAWETLTQRLGRVSIELAAHMPYAESIGTTLDPLTTDVELWQIGQGLILVDENGDPKYTHSTSSFSIYNAGDVTVNQRKRPLKITYTGASMNLSIENLTTGDEWQYDHLSVEGDQIVLDGIRSLKNGTSIFKDTNKKIITLAPGWNDFILSGTSGSFSIEFDFRFYYL